MDNNQTDQHQPDPTHTISVAEHIEEFGEVGRVVHIDADNRIRNPSETIVSDGGHVRKKHPLSILFHALFQRRYLMQFFYNDILFRSRDTRPMSREELFLDLVLVGAIAALGHHLRIDYSWPRIQEFILLFTAIYSAWREIVVLWNLFDIKEDFIDKFGIYFSFLAISGVAVAGLDPFQSKIRPWVSVSAFLATFIPLVAIWIYSTQEPMLKIKANRVNPLKLNVIFSFLTIIPYFVATFVQSENTAKILFFVVLLLQPVTLFPAVIVYDFLERGKSKYTRIAFAIGHLVEKLEVMTMIFMGESVIALLSEGGELIVEDDVKVYKVYLSALMVTVTLYSLQTFYIQADNTIPEGGIHALRYDEYRGLLWWMLHWPFHLCLVLFATGLGIGIRDVIVPVEHGSEGMLIREDGHGGVHAEGQQFVDSARWLFAVGWAGAVICSALIGLMHYGGPRSVTKPYRIIVRLLVAVGLLVGMPLSNLSAGLFMMVFTVVSVVLALTEFVLMKVDLLGLLADGEGDDSSSEEHYDGGNREGDVEEEEVNWQPDESSMDSEGNPVGISSALTKRVGLTRRGEGAGLVAFQKRNVLGHRHRHHGLG